MEDGAGASLLGLTLSEVDDDVTTDHLGVMQTLINKSLEDNEKKFVLFATKN